MTKAIATRTVNPLHFEDLEPHRFEDLVRQLAHGFRNWSRLEATGALGLDGGRDILGVESLTQRTRSSPNDEDNEEELIVDERLWLFQCKRYKTLGPKDVVKILREAVPEGSEPPYGFVLAAPCKLSATAMADFHAERARLGIREAHLWVNNHLEDMLFSPENDHLLFAYFGISLQIRRQGVARQLRAAIGAKKKILRLGEQGRIDSRLSVDCLIRNIDGDEYFSIKSYADQFTNVTPTAWHQGVLDDFYLHGVRVELNSYIGWVKPDGAWDILRGTHNLPGVYTDAHGFFDSPERPDGLQQLVDAIPEQERKLIFVLGWLPFSNIVEVDDIGDPLYPMPHIYCKSEQLYSEISYRAFEPFHPKELDNAKRTPIFKELVKQLGLDYDLNWIPLPIRKEDD